jgi:hypothetical protein
LLGSPFCSEVSTWHRSDFPKPFKGARTGGGTDMTRGADRQSAGAAQSTAARAS